MLKLGLYRHFKGNYYKVIGTATHSETLEKMVVYVPQYGEQEIWVRPLDNFLSPKIVDGKAVQRFTYIGEE